MINFRRHDSNKYQTKAFVICNHKSDQNRSATHVFKNKHTSGLIDVLLATKGGFPLLRNFYVCTHVHFTRVNKIETMYGMSLVNVKVDTPSTFTFTRSLSYIASISFCA